MATSAAPGSGVHVMIAGNIHRMQKGPTRVQARKMAARRTALTVKDFEINLSMAESALQEARDETGHSVNCVCPICNCLEEALGVVYTASALTLGDEQNTSSDEDDDE